MSPVNLLPMFPVHTERSFGWAARFKRLSRDYERLASTLTGMHWLAFATLMFSSLFGKS